MRQLKIVAGVLVAVLVLSANKTAYAEEVTADSGIAGITLILNEYYNNAPADEEIYVDGVKLQEDSFLDIGLPVGPALPVVIKTLILSSH